MSEIISSLQHHPQQTITLLVKDSRLWHTDTVIQNLTEKESERLLSIKKDQAKQNYLVSRLLVKHIAKHLYNIPPSTSYLHINSNQQLRIMADGKPLALSVSLSHSHSSVALLVSLQANICVGVDIEYPNARRAFDTIANEYFAPEEAGAVEVEADFLTLWTQKEALCKALSRNLYSILPLDAQDLASSNALLLHTHPIRNGFLSLAIPNNVANCPVITLTPNAIST